MILDINKETIYLVTTTPGINVNSSVNISWHSRKKGSYLLYKEEQEKDFTKISPKEEYWSLEECFEDDDYQTKRYVCQTSLNNLKNDSKYIYKIVVDDINSIEYHFKTTSEKEVAFLGFADLQYSCNEMSLKLIKTFKEKNPHISLITCSGDIADEGSIELNHRYLIDSQIFENNIVAVAVGDHEYWGKSQKPYTQFKRPYSYNKLFNNPKNGIDKYLNTTYYFKNNDVLFVFLDCHDSNARGNEEIFIEQVKWLDEVLLQEQNNKFIIVYMHKSLYGAYEQDKAILNIKKHFIPVFDKYQVDIVISGHDHEYSRTNSLINDEVQSNGTIYLDLGSSGDKRRKTDESIKQNNIYIKYIDILKSSEALGLIGLVKDNTLLLEVRNQYYQLVDCLKIKTKHKLY